MVYLYVGAAIIVGLLIGFVALSVRLVAQKVTANIRERAAELLSSYDELIEKKSRQLKRVANAVTEKEAELKELSDEETAGGYSDENARVTDPSYVLNVAEKMGAAKYQDPRTGAVYQKIRRNFTHDALEVIGQLVPDIDVKGDATSMLEKLDYDTVYRLSALSAEDQVDLLRETFNERGNELIDDYLRTEKRFQAIGFYDYLMSRAMSEPQCVTLKVAPSQKLPFMPEGVEVVIDDDICEGFEVEANNKLYDYCVRKSEIS